MYPGHCHLLAEVIFNDSREKLMSINRFIVTGSSSGIGKAICEALIRKKINVIYSKPSVFQDRNLHDLGLDLKKELIGLKYTSAIINKMSKKQFKLIDFFSKKSIKAYKLYLKHFK